MATTAASLTERPNLLVAEDDRAFCEVLARALDARGFDVVLAHDGVNALRLAVERTPEYAVVDLRLPDMSGLKLLEKLKEIDEHTNVVVLTGYGSIATAVEAVKRGATYYLTKPTSADQIVAAFERHDASFDVPLAARQLSVERLEWEYIQRVLTELDGNISAAARALSMHRRTLQRKLNKHPPRS
jgi:two-component system response regulator RegA